MPDTVIKQEIEHLIQRQHEVQDAERAASESRARWLKITLWAAGIVITICSTVAIAWAGWVSSRLADPTPPQWFVERVVEVKAKAESNDERLDRVEVSLAALTEASANMVRAIQAIQAGRR